MEGKKERERERERETLELNDRFPRFVPVSFVTYRTILSLYLSLSLSATKLLFRRALRFHRTRLVQPSDTFMLAVYKIY